MTKAGVMYPVIATAFVALLLLHSHQNTHKHGHRRHVRFSRRLGDPLALHFDPLVSKMEQLAELKNLLKAAINERKKNRDNDNKENKINNHDEQVEISDAEIEEEDGMYFGEDRNLNLTMTLTLLFPMIDSMPKDGHVGSKELEHWNIMQAYERMHHRTRKVLDQIDGNGDGFISFSEYLPHFSDEDIKKNNMDHGEAGWWMKQFKNVDVDQDGQLNFEELQDFLHPEDSKNKNVQEWLLHDKIKKMDKDNDGMLNYEEFRDDAYDTFKTYLFGTGDTHAPSAQIQFSTLDVDGDRYLTAEELKPIQHYLLPGELNYATYITTYLMKEVDDNHDGRLSLDEILRHETKFYHSIYIADDEDEEEDYVHIHDEF